MWRTVSRREWVMLIGVGLATAVLTLLPYGLGYLTAADGLVFTGLIMNPEDSQTYFAKMLQGYNGRFLYSIPFTPEPHDAAFVGVFYIWLGQLARLLGLSLAAIWQWARLLADMILFVTIYGFIATFLADVRARITAYLLALFGSGFGWLLFVLGQPYWLDAFPVDFKQPGAHIFFTALTFPHIILGTALILYSLWLLWAAVQVAKPNSWHGWRQTAVAGLVNIALGIAYPFLIYLIAAVAGLYWLMLSLQARRILWQQSFIFALAFLIPAPLYLYYAYVLQVNAVFAAWDAQAATPSFPWPHYLVAYGLMLLLGGLHWRSFPAQRRQFALLWLWVVAVVLLIYAPINPQRRFVQGVHVPLAILTTAAFYDLLLPRWQQSRLWQRLLRNPRYSLAGLARLMAVAFLAIMSISNLYVIGSVSVSAVIQQPDPLFRASDEAAAVKWLRENGVADAVVMGAYQTGNFIAGQAGQRVMLGHWAETVNFSQKQKAVAQFYATDTPAAARQALLCAFDVRYVWVGPRERALGDFAAETAVYLTPRYQNDSITIYEVRR